MLTINFIIDRIIHKIEIILLKRRRRLINAIGILDSINLITKKKDLFKIYDKLICDLHRKIKVKCLT